MKLSSPSPASSNAPFVTATTEGPPEWRTSIAVQTFPNKTAAAVTAVPQKLVSVALRFRPDLLLRRVPTRASVLDHELIRRKAPSMLEASRSPVRWVPSVRLRNVRCSLAVPVGALHPTSEVTCSPDSATLAIFGVRGCGGAEGNIGTSRTDMDGDTGSGSGFSSFRGCCLHDYKSSKNSYRGNCAGASF